MIVDFLIVLFLLLSGMLAGVLFTVEIAVVPMVRALPGEPFVRVHTLLDRQFDPLMPRVNKVTLVICAALVAFAPGLAAKVAFAIAGLCIVGVAVVSEVFNVRMNRRIAAWNPRDLPAGWLDVRARWASANRVRTVIALAGFLGAISGVAFAWA